MPRKMRRLALRSALSVKVAEGSLVVLDNLSVATPKTQEVLGMLDRLQIASSTLILLPERNANVELSANNIPDVKTLRATSLNVVDILKYDTLVLPMQAVSVIEQILG